MSLEYRQDLPWFAWQMALKLGESRNEAKGAYREMTVEELLDRIEDEVAELRLASGPGFSPADIANECVDVANFAMMLAAKVARP